MHSRRRAASPQRTGGDRDLGAVHKHLRGHLGVGRVQIRRFPTQLSRSLLHVQFVWIIQNF